jgi:ribosomal protein L22
LATVGCHKNATVKNAPKTLQESVADLRSALATANADVQNNFNHNVAYNIRYGDFPKASAALQQIAGDASLNDAQKKAASDVNDVLKQTMANAQNPAPPGK